MRSEQLYRAMQAVSRKYVNSRETATLETWEGHTEAGARRWASKVLSN